MTTKEENILIAEFMGYKSYEFRGYTMFVYEENNHRTDTDLHYHTSWDWLMPVVEKIEDMGSEIVITNAECTISAPNGYYEETIDKKRFGATHTAVVEFINDYNNHNK